MTKLTEWRAPSEDSDQPGHPPSLCALRKAKGPKVSSRGQGRLWSDWANAQADLGLRWADRSFCWFCHAVAQLHLGIITNVYKLYIITTRHRGICSCFSLDHAVWKLHEFFFCCSLVTAVYFLVPPFTRRPNDKLNLSYALQLWRRLERRQAVFICSIEREMYYRYWESDSLYLSVP